MKIKCQLCKRLSDEDYRAIKWNEVVVCEDCAQKLIEAYGKKVESERRQEI
jgi:hypothetical protein